MFMSVYKWDWCVIHARHTWFKLSNRVTNLPGDFVVPSSFTQTILDLLNIPGPGQNALILFLNSPPSVSVVGKCLVLMEVNVPPEMETGRAAGSP